MIHGLKHLSTPTRNETDGAKYFEDILLYGDAITAQTLCYDVKAVWMSKDVGSAKLQAIKK